MYTPKSNKGTAYLKSLIQVKNELKNKQTKAEIILWNEIRNRKLKYKFRRQHIINNFIVDFYCVEKMIAIEADGEVHNLQKIRDMERDDILRGFGINVIRFSNYDIENNLESCLAKVRQSFDL